MRADMAYRKSGPTQAILLVECGLFSGIREDEKIQTYVQSYWREIDKHNLPEGGRSCRPIRQNSFTLLSKDTSGSWRTRKSRPSCRRA